MVKRKTILTVAGETERYLYFVVEGVQRAFYLGEKNKDEKKLESIKNSISGSDLATLLYTVQLGSISVDPSARTT